MYKIAIIDDEVEISDSLERFFAKKEIYETTAYNNPLEALENIENNYDIILLDIMMPQMNGLDVLAKIIEINPKQKVIIMTAYSSLDSVIKSQKLGAVHYMVKPFESLKAVEDKVSELLAQ